MVVVVAQRYLPGGVLIDNVTFYLALVAVARFTVLTILWWIERIVITDKRVMLAEGFIVHKVGMMPLSKVADLTFVTSMQRTQHAEPIDERIDFFFTARRWAGEPRIVEPAKCAALEWFPLSALPDPTVALPVAHLAALMGIKVTHLTTVSTELRRGGHVVPATLVRPGGWSGKGSSNLPIADRTVALPRCPWPDCDSPVATGVLLLPELVLGCNTTVLCRACLRPPTRNLRFPEAYGALLDDRPVRTGTWVHCANHGCVLDLGAGAGLLWRWDDTPSSQETRHAQCAPVRRS